MMAQHDIGDAVRLWSVFRDESGDQAAPTTVTLIVHHPDGEDESVATTPAVAGDVSNAATATGQTLADETGLYKASVTPDEAGFWHYEWTGVGAIAETEQGWFEVRRRRVGDPA
jgi:hypothetical protein